jgi:hypothetical protein
MLNVVMLTVIMLSVVAPSRPLCRGHSAPTDKLESTSASIKSIKLYILVTYEDPK